MSTDLIDKEAVKKLVRHFYQKLLNDKTMAPMFLEVAQIDIEEHLPRIENYWCKMLFGQPVYKRHMMNKHRAVRAKRDFEADHFDTWITYFQESVDELFVGEYAEKAKRIANNAIRNMKNQFLSASQT